MAAQSLLLTAFLVSGDKILKKLKIADNLKKSYSFSAKIVIE
jgi:hypothetical protein